MLTFKKVEATGWCVGEFIVGHRLERLEKPDELERPEKLERPERLN